MLDITRFSRGHAGRFGRNDDLALRAKSGESLTLDEMRVRLPAIFAEQPHESRSDRYVYISTAEMLEALMEKEFMPVEARVSRSRIPGKQEFTKHMLRFRPYRDLVPAPDRKVGDVSFEVILRNAHDGTAAYDFMAGLLKLLCLNGLVVSDGMVEQVKVRHTGNRERQLRQVIEGAFTVLDQGPKVLESVEHWQGINLNPDERMAYAEAAHTVRFADSEGVVATPIAPSSLLIARRPAEVGKTSLWDVFNVVQENVIRGGLTGMGRDKHGRPKRSTTREIKAIDGDIKLNKALWALAEKMASLKA